MYEKITFEINVNSQVMIVKYDPDYIPRYLAHFEFHSPYQPPKQIPVSETGYLSHFVHVESLKNVKDIKDYACQIAHHIFIQKFGMDNNRAEDGQMSLF